MPLDSRLVLNFTPSIPVFVVGGKWSLFLVVFLSVSVLESHANLYSILIPLSFTKKTHWSQFLGQVDKGDDCALRLFLALESSVLGFLLFSVTQPKKIKHQSHIIF